MGTKQRSPLMVIFLTVFIDLLGFGIVLPLLPRYAEKFQASDMTLGMLMASFSAMQFLFSPLWGRLSDRIGRRPVLLIGLCGSAVFYTVFGYATAIASLPLIFASRVAAGIAGATISTAQAFIADSTPPDERGKGMAIIGAAFGIGFTFGPLLGSFWVSDAPGTTPSPAPGYVAGALSLAAFCFAFVALPESLRPDSLPAERHWFNMRSLRASLQIPTMVLLIVTFFIATFAFANFESTLTRLTKSTGFDFSDRDNFYIFAYVGLVLSLAQGFLVRRMLPIIGEVWMVTVGSVLMAAGMFGIGASAARQSSAMLLGCLPVAVVGFACLTPSLQALVSRRSAASIQGEMLGVVQSASSLARILGPVCGNLLFGFGTTHGIPYFFGAGVMGTVVVLSLGLARGN